MTILGIGGLDHNGSACIVRGGEVVSFLELERITRRKNQPIDTPEALALLADRLGVGTDVEHVAVADRSWYRERSWLADFLASRWPRATASVHGHHDCHLAAAFATSSFDEATAVSIDGKGDGLSAAAALARRQDPLQIVLGVPSAHSIGRLWWALCDFVGLPGHHAAGKAMALAAYGRPVYLEDLQARCRAGTRGGFRFDASGEHPDLFRQVPRLVDWMCRLSGSPPGGGAPGQVHMDMAASVQRLTERLVVALCAEAVTRTGIKSLCLAGGVALNGLANERVLESGVASALHVAPLTDDRGLALGAAVIAAQERGRAVRATGQPLSPYLGPLPDLAGADAALFGYEGTSKDSVPAAARLLATGRVLAWYEGRDEAGPRALGNRSILASPVYPGMRDHLNRTVKRREWFRPFGCSVPVERVSDWFMSSGHSPFMLRIVRVRPERAASIPSAVHCDGTTRLHTVTQAGHPRLAALLRCLEAHGEPPLVLNTSLNGAGEPMAHTPQDALSAASAGQADAIMLGGRLLERVEEA